MSIEFGRRSPVGQGSGAGSEMGPGGGSGRPGGETAATGGDLVRAAAPIAAAALLGFGLILRVAANWDDFGRLQRIGIVAAVLAVALAVSFMRQARSAGLLVAFAATGGLFAVIGQTYQTGADPWQLFAIWAAVGLPWALAARHDALWLCWSVVAVTAISLWLRTFGTSGLWLVADGVPVTVAAWLMAIGVLALVSPWSPVKPLIGRSRWSFRIASLLVIALVTQGALAGLFARSQFGSVYLVGLLVLGLMAFVLAFLEPLDMVLLAAVGLGIDIALIGGLIRAAFQGNSDFLAPLFFTGLIGAGIVAGTAALGLAIARKRLGVTTESLSLEHGWPMLVATGIGALLVSIPVIFFLAVLFGSVLTRGPAIYVIGLGIIAASVAGLWRGKRLGFMQQFSTVALLVGLLLVAVGLFRDAGGQSPLPFLLMLGLVCGVALAVGQAWITALLGAVAGVLAAKTLGFVLGGGSGLLGALPGTGSWSVLLAAGALFLFFRCLGSGGFGGLSRSSPMLAGLDSMVAGALAGGIIGLVFASGPTLLIAGTVGWLPRQMHLPTEAGVWWSAISPVSGVLGLAAVGVALARRQGAWSPLDAGVAAVAVALSFVINGLGALVLVMAAANATGRRALTVGAAAGAIWVIGSFYYALHWSLVDKATLMIGAGVAIGSLAWVAHAGLARFGATMTEGGTPVVAGSLIAAGA
ncbi:MAG TPA: DUF4401 domain-containing protein, partial [Hyphomicrobiaceae bacterium]|nr:DUF4401 domain-containing protein [Hyphomicrobiaceae bacterium]